MTSTSEWLLRTENGFRFASNPEATISPPKKLPAFPPSCSLVLALELTTDYGPERTIVTLASKVRPVP